MASLTSGINACVLGLGGIGDAMNAHAQNIATAGVTASKKRDVFLSALNTDPSTGSFTPGGIQSTTIQDVAAVGSSTPSDVPTNMSISGQGMFIVSPSAANGTGAAFGLTRVGTFNSDENGNLANHNGYFLQVFYTDQNGNPLSTDVSTFTNLQTASTKGLTGTPLPTSHVTLPLTLPANAIVGGAGAVQTTPITVIDSLGLSHTLTLTWTKTAQVIQSTNPVTLVVTPGSQTWTVSMAGTPPSDVVSIGAPYSAGMSIIFDNTGKPSSFNGAAAAPPNLTVNWNNPSAPSTIAMDLGTIGGTNGLICDGTNYQINNKIDIDGRPTGQFLSASIDSNGFMWAIFSNGQSQMFARVPIATFPNMDGLIENSYGFYTQSASSGPFTLQFPGQGSAGAITPSSLEDSTIDPAEVFTDMIVDQKRYTANLKGITTIEKMLDALERSIGA